MECGLKSDFRELMEWEQRNWRLIRENFCGIFFSVPQGNRAIFSSSEVKRRF